MRDEKRYTRVAKGTLLQPLTMISGGREKERTKRKRERERERKNGRGKRTLRPLP